MSACEETSTGGLRLGSGLGGSLGLNLLTDLDHHQVFAEFQRTGVSLPCWRNQILLGPWNGYPAIGWLWRKPASKIPACPASQCVSS
jgi:hypothetical protein